MSTNKKDGFIDKVSGFFKRVSNNDTIKFGDGRITNIDQPIEPEEREKVKDMQIFRQFLNQKNWSVKHTELFDEYRRMDLDYPIIAAALKIYSQETCLAGDTIIPTPFGDLPIRDLYKMNKRDFYVKSIDFTNDRVEWNTCKKVVNNGLRPVYRVVLHKSMDNTTLKNDKIKVAEFKCTDNHMIMDATGEFKPLSQFSATDRVSSFYYSVDPSCSCQVPNINTTYIESIELVGEEEVYDLVDVAPNHFFMIKLTNSFYGVVHNCTKDTEGNVLQIVSSNKKVKNLLENLFFKELKINSTSHLHVKSMLKFGNHYSYLETRRGVGVVDLIHMPPESIKIELNQNGLRLDDFKFKGWGAVAGLEFEPWQLVHWRNIDDLETEPYGQSILRPIVATYRRIILLREAMIVYRITRAPQRLLFKIDSTGLGPEEALRHADNLKQQMYKKPLINPHTGELDTKYNPISIQENIYMTTYEGDNSSVSTLEGACMRHDTKLLTNEGTMTIKKLAELMESGYEKKIYALSCNSHGIISSGKILWCGPTNKVSKLHRININGKIVECTDNHPFLLTSMEYKRADELKIGDAIKNMFDDDVFVNDIEIIDLEVEETVYDLEVEDYHNFALESGIFVHNSNLDAVEDFKIIKDDLFAGLMIPKSYLNFEEDLSNKAALAQEDIRFANAIKQIQSYYIEGLLHIALVHLHINGCSKAELADFEIQMNTNSTLAEKTRKELLEQRFAIAQSAWNPENQGLNYMSFTQTCKDILKFTDEQIEKSIQDQFLEKKIQWRLASIAENGSYQEPDQDRKEREEQNQKANDIFSNIIFENGDPKTGKFATGVRAILTEKIDEEIGFLLNKAAASPTTIQIERIQNNFTFKDSLTNNIRRTRSEVE